MSSNYNNKIFICGFVPKDAEIHTTTSGKQVANFSVKFRTTKQEDGKFLDEWFKVQTWDSNQDCFQIASNIVKGDTIICAGIPQKRNYTNRDGEEKTSNEFLAEFIIPQRAINSILFSMVANSIDIPEFGDTGDLPF